VAKTRFIEEEEAGDSTATSGPSARLARCINCAFYHKPWCVAAPLRDLPPCPSTFRVSPTAWAAAKDLGQLNLADALDLALPVAEQDPEKYPRVALRWNARYCAERSVTLWEAQAVLALLALADPLATATLRDIVRR